MKSILTIVLLIISNSFMTLAWYGHLQFQKYSWFHKLSLFGVVLFSWGLAFFEYLFQVPANRIGFEGNGGPYNLFQLKIIQEAVTLTMFSIFAIFIFKTDKFQWNYLVGFALIMLAVFFIFKKW